MLYLILACLLYLCDLLRRRKAHKDFSDAFKDVTGPQRWDEADLHPPVQPLRSAPAKDPRDRVFGAPFVTAGWVVIAVTGVVAAVEISLLGLLLKL